MRSLLVLLLLLLSTVAEACVPTVLSRDELVVQAAIVVKGRLLQIASDARDSAEATVFRVEKSLRGDVPPGDYELINGDICALEAYFQTLGVADPEAAIRNITDPLEQAVRLNRIIFVPAMDVDSIPRDRYLMALKVSGNRLVVPAGWPFGMAIKDGYIVDEIGFIMPDWAFENHFADPQISLVWSIPEDTSPERRCFLESYQRRNDPGLTLQQQERISAACLFAAQAVTGKVTEKNKVVCLTQRYPDPNALLAGAPAIVYGKVKRTGNSVVRQFQVEQVLRGSLAPDTSYTVIASCGNGEAWTPVSFNDLTGDEPRFLFVDEVLGSVLVVPERWRDGMMANNGRVFADVPCSGIPDKTCQLGLSEQLFRYYLYAIAASPDQARPALAPPQWQLFTSDLSNEELCQVEMAKASPDPEVLRRCAERVQAQQLAQRSFKERLADYWHNEVRAFFKLFTPWQFLLCFALLLAPALFLRRKWHLWLWVSGFTVAMFVTALVSITRRSDIANTGWYDFQLLCYFIPAVLGVWVGFMIRRIWKKWPLSGWEYLLIAALAVLTGLGMTPSFLETLGIFLKSLMA